MPELPEVETVRAALEPVMQGVNIARVVLRRSDLRFPIPENFQASTVGHRVLSVGRRGKYCLVHLNNATTIILHLGMSGRILILTKAQAHNYDYAKHDHVIFEMANGHHIVFNDARRFGYILCVPTADLDQTPPFSKMGPEPLGNEFSGPILAARLKGKTAPIKTALLDQRVVSGIGNIYACEALYDAGISPFRKAGAVQGQRAEKLAHAIQDVLRRAIAAGGSSLKDYKQADGSLGYFQHGFVVYDREGQACGDCDCNISDTNGIKREVQAGRSTFYCPRQQK